MAVVIGSVADPPSSPVGRLVVVGEADGPVTAASAGSESSVLLQPATNSAPAPARNVRRVGKRRCSSIVR